jgi:hypothetical protein
LSAPEEAPVPTGTPTAEEAEAVAAAEPRLSGLGWAAKERREKRRARSTAAARRKLKEIVGPDWPVDVDPIGFRFSLVEDVNREVSPRHLLRRCVVARPFVREVFVLAMTACGGSQRSERSFQIPGSKQEAVDRALELIPSQVIYASDAWKAQNKRPQVREEKLKKELERLSCPFDPTVRVGHHPDNGATACAAVVVTASETQGMFCKVVTRPCAWLDEESPVNAWHGGAVRPPEPIAADEAVRLAHAMGEAEIEIEDPDGILAPLEDLVRSHLVVRAVSGLPGLAEMVDGKPGGWPPAADREVSAEQARREVAKALGSKRQVLLDPEVADVLRMAAARPALDGDIKPPQRIAVDSSLFLPFLGRPQPRSTSPFFCHLAPREPLKCRRQPTTPARSRATLRLLGHLRLGQGAGCRISPRWPYGKCYVDRNEDLGRTGATLPLPQSSILATFWLSPQ